METPLETWHLVLKGLWKFTFLKGFKIWQLKFERNELVELKLKTKMIFSLNRITLSHCRWYMCIYLLYILFVVYQQREPSKRMSAYQRTKKTFKKMFVQIEIHQLFSTRWSVKICLSVCSTTLRISITPTTLTAEQLSCSPSSTS